MQPPNDLLKDPTVLPSAQITAQFLGAVVRDRPDGTIEYVAEDRTPGWSRWSDAALAADRALREREAP